MSTKVRLYNYGDGNKSSGTKLQAEFNNLYNSVNASDAASESAVITANSADAKADTAIITANSADAKADSAIITANSADTKADTAIATSNSADAKADAALTNANSASNFANDARMAAETAATAAQSAVGNTVIRYEVYTIVNSNIGDGTFSYKDSDDVVYIGALGGSGEQIFTLLKGNYPLEEDRIEMVINDTLQRTTASGGLLEIDNTHVALTVPVGNGAEVTIKYYEKLGLAGQHKLSHGVGEYDEVAGLVYRGTVAPASATAYWLKVVE